MVVAAAVIAAAITTEIAVMIAIFRLEVSVGVGTDGLLRREADASSSYTSAPALVLGAPGRCRGSYDQCKAQDDDEHIPGRCT